MRSPDSGEHTADAKALRHDEVQRLGAMGASAQCCPMHLSYTGYEVGNQGQNDFRVIG